MSRSLYITGLEAGSGKKVLALGIMDQLAGRIGTAGVFRPVIDIGFWSAGVSFTF